MAGSLYLRGHTPIRQSFAGFWLTKKAVRKFLVNHNKTIALSSKQHYYKRRIKSKP